MKNLFRRKGLALASVILLIVIITAAVDRGAFGTLFTVGKYDTEEHMVETLMAKTATPGVAIVSSKQGNTDYKVYGYADVDLDKKVTEESLFELGSTTKAFTALAIILLKDEGKLAYSDAVSEYLPRFVPTFQEENVNITIDQLLAHTSGIPSWSIKLIPEGTTENLLDETINKISDISLDTYPGAEYQYATVNYDILAMIIEKVTGTSYQNYVTQNILVPLKMTDSYFSTGQEQKPDQLTRGYRVFFGKSFQYDAPRYYGNIAAGYLVTNIKDLEHWMNAQLGMGDIPEGLRRAIRQSHEVDLQTAGYEEKNQYYSYGWSNDPEERVISHSGSNPNYSSHFIMDIGKLEAVLVLTNLNSTAPSLIAHNLHENMNGNPMNKFTYDDSYILLDLIFSFLALLAAISFSLKVIKLAGGSKQNKNVQKTRNKRIIVILVIILRAMLLVMVMFWPYLLNNNYYMISVWMSYSLFLWMGLVSLSCMLSIILNLKKLGVLRSNLS
ncbi:hypothetical protein H70357_22175 [Paenibacillus sp. FSL H7-0357]|uniref:serine hydrolase domain-containing protein n=1 Tax=Paenibacillus sp. FSL H7-0357 TaxID=1536774 RepID=UPI0004F811F4|nr:serine hydrolase domain-containing protein [Paenibacillus sp. FSL H7-0357]AIQ19114.1 hypothetical protein H70357_22175 [Paenibacillus sp. FSL H7-0357]